MINDSVVLARDLLARCTEHTANGHAFVMAGVPEITQLARETLLRAADSNNGPVTPSGDVLRGLAEELRVAAQLATGNRLTEIAEAIEVWSYVVDRLYHTLLTSSVKTSPLRVGS